MKKTFIIITMLGLITLLSGCSISDVIELENDDYQVILETYLNEGTYEEYGSTAAFHDTEYTLEEMLVYAIQDEYAARAEYEYILANFDITKPFSNIINAEETHISLLLPLFETYEFEVPVDESSNYLIPPTDLGNTFDIGVLAEILNIEMYNLFLTQDDLPDDVRDVFIELRDASMNHLEAFEKNAEKY